MIFPGTPGRFSDHDHAMRSNVGKGPKGDGIIADVVNNDPYGVYRVQFKNSRTGEVYLTTPNMDPGSRIYFCSLTLQYQSSEDVDVSYTVPLRVFFPQQVGTIRDARVGDIVFYKLRREGTLDANAIGIGIITNLSLDDNVTFMQHSVLDIENIDEVDAQVRRLQEDADNIEVALDTVQSTLDDLPSYDEFLSLSEDVRRNESDITTKIPWPVTPYSKYGTDGQVLRTNADGSTQWQNPIIPTDAQAETYINAWLNAHPEATTTVQDGAIVTAKLANGAVTDAKLAQTGGVLEHVGQEYLASCYRDNLILSETIGTNLLEGAIITPRDANYFENIQTGVFKLRQLTTGSNFVNISIPVEIGKQYIISLFANGSTERMEYGFSNNPITTPSASRLNVFNSIIITPAATNAWLLITVAITAFMNDTLCTLLVVEKGVKLASSLPELVSSEISELEAQVEESYAPIVCVNLFDTSAITDNCYVNYANGNLIAHDGTKATDYISVVSGDNYTIDVGMPTVGVQQMAWYNRNKQYISGLANSGIRGRLTVTAPNNASFLRWTIFNEALNTTQIVHGNTVGDYIPYSTVKIPLEYIPEIPLDYLQDTIVNVGAEREYTSILRALKEAPEDYVIYVHDGEYNVQDEYTNYYGADFWENYSGYAGIDDKFYAGYWIQNRKIIFSPRSKIVFNNTSSNQAIASYFSVFATAENAEIYYATIEFSNLRYAIHDDYANEDGITKFVGLTFIGTPHSNAIIGAGCRNNNVYVIEDCVFLNNNGLHDISYHNSAGSSSCCKIIVKNCYGSRRCAFRWMGNSQLITRCVVSSSHFGEIVCIPYDSSVPYENMALYSFCNEVTSE